MLSNKFIFIFKFSNINSVLFTLFATIPPTFAAAFIIGPAYALIKFSVSSLINKFVSFLVEG